MAKVTNTPPARTRKARPERPGTSAELVHHLTFQAELQEWARLRELAAARNVDVGAKPAERAAQFIALARDAIQSLDGSVASALLTFHVRTGWHEGWDLTKRTQYPKGQGRGFLQMEPGAAIDAIDRATRKKWIDKLAAAAATTAGQLQDAAKELSLGSPWPAGNLIEEKLLGYDLFALMMARAYLSRLPDAVPADIVLQSDFWEKHWHRVVAPQKKAKWLDDAKRLDKLVTWS